MGRHGAGPGGGASGAQPILRRDPILVPNAPPDSRRTQPFAPPRWGGVIPPGRVDLDARVRDRVARVTVTQAFANSTGATLEGDYYFPLPPACR